MERDRDGNGTCPLGRSRAGEGRRQGVRIGGAATHTGAGWRQTLRRAFVVMLAMGLAATAAPARAETTPVPRPCTRVHQNHVVHPGCLPAVTGVVNEALDPGLTLPNLLPDVQEIYIDRPFVYDPQTETFVPGAANVHFDTWAINRGTVPLQVTLDDVQDPQSSTVSQCVSWTATYVCREQRQVGGFTWHDEHTHFHLEEFAAYEFRRLGPNGRPDYSAAGVIGVSDKVSFCLMDTTPVKGDATPTGVYTSCTPAMQGISPGWADVYGGGIPGQQFPIEHLTDGRYALVVHLNPASRLLETDTSDNVVEITIELANGLTEARVVGRHRP